jgi:hypothetical protein
MMSRLPRASGWGGFAVIANCFRNWLIADPLVLIDSTLSFKQRSELIWLSAQSPYYRKAARTLVHLFA